MDLFLCLLDIRGSIIKYQNIDPNRRYSWFIFGCCVVTVAILVLCLVFFFHYNSRLESEMKDERIVYEPLAK